MRLLIKHFRSLCFCREIEIPVAVSRDFESPFAATHPHQMPWSQRRHSVEGAHARGYRLHELVQGRPRIQPGFHVRMREDRLNLGPIDQRRAVGGHPGEQRPHPEPVTHQQQFVAFPIIQGESKLAPQLLRKIETHLAIQAQGDFRVRLRREPAPFRHQTSAVVFEIIELAVDREHTAPVSGLDGLRASFQIIDREAGMTQRDPPRAIDVVTGRIRAPVANRHQLVRQCDGGVFRQRSGGERSSNTTHQSVEGFPMSMKLGRALSRPSTAINNAWRMKMAP